MDLKKNLEKLNKLTDENLKELKYKVSSDVGELKLYAAGKNKSHEKDYFRVFPRDAFTSIILLKDPEFLKNLLIFCIKKQGQKIDPFTGEEPGKIPHEFPGVNLRNKNTEYAAIDTTAFFIIGFGLYREWTKDKKFIKENKNAILSAFNFYKKHLKKNLIWDNPKYYNSKITPLWSGCWRDGGYSERKKREHTYPASYFMINSLFIKVLRTLIDLTKEKILNEDVFELEKQIEKTKKTLIKNFWIKNKGYFASALDKKGIIKTFYLDPIWSLYFLEERDLDRDKIDQIFENLKKLKTNFGYLSHERMHGSDYEGNKIKLRDRIWPLEQAFLAKTADKFGIEEVKENCLLLTSFLASGESPFSEYIEFKNNKPILSGCNIQLWTIAYINSMHNLFFPKFASK